MALPELIANSPTPGAKIALAALSAAMTDTTGLSMSTSAAAPTALRAATGQFRVVVDSEIMLVAASSSGASPWTILQRGAEGSTAATHANGAAVFHYLTAGGLTAVASPLQPVAQSADYTAIPGDLVLMTGAHTVTLPAVPILGTQVGVVALSGNVSVSRAGSDQIVSCGAAAANSITVLAGANVTLRYLTTSAGTYWYVLAGTPVGPASFLQLPSAKQLVLSSGQAVTGASAAIVGAGTGDWTIAAGGTGVATVTYPVKAAGGSTAVTLTAFYGSGPGVIAQATSITGTGFTVETSIGATPTTSSFCFVAIG